MEKIVPKVVAVIAEKTLDGVFRAATKISDKEKYSVDMVEVWLDCLRPGILTEDTLPIILGGIRHRSKKRELNVAIRHIDSVAPEKKHYRGYKGDRMDWDRNNLLRKVVKFRPSFLEVEYNHRWGLLFVPKTITRYSNFTETPDFEELVDIYDEIMRVGSDVVKFETYVREKKDLDKLRKLREHAKDNLLVTLALGRKGKKMWREAFEDGSPFVYGHTNRAVDYIFGDKKPHDYMPSLEDVCARIRGLRNS